MNVKILFREKVVFNNIIDSKDQHKIPQAFEYLSTQLKCPKCFNNSLVKTSGSIPALDNRCTYFNCGHGIEVKSIIALGKQKNSYKSDKNIFLKLGSIKTYEDVKKKNKSLLLFWYNVIKEADSLIELVIRDSIIIDMDKLNNGYNCKTSIVLQKKKGKYKKRVKLEIFPEFLYNTMFPNQFSGLSSLNNKNQSVDDVLNEYKKVLQQIKKYNNNCLYILKYIKYK